MVDNKIMSHFGGEHSAAMQRIIDNKLTSNQLKCCTCQNQKGYPRLKNWHEIYTHKNDTGIQCLEVKVIVTFYSSLHPSCAGLLHKHWTIQSLNSQLLLPQSETLPFHVLPPFLCYLFPYRLVLSFLFLLILSPLSFSFHVWHTFPSMFSFPIHRIFSLQCLMLSFPFHLIFSHPCLIYFPFHVIFSHPCLIDFPFHLIFSHPCLIYFPFHLIFSLPHYLFPSTFDIPLPFHIWYTLSSMLSSLFHSWYASPSMLSFPIHRIFSLQCLTLSFPFHVILSHPCIFSLPCYPSPSMLSFPFQLWCYLFPSMLSFPFPSSMLSFSFYVILSLLCDPFPSTFDDTVFPPFHTILSNQTSSLWWGKSLCRGGTYIQHTHTEQSDQRVIAVQQHF